MLASMRTGGSGRISYLGVAVLSVAILGHAYSVTAQSQGCSPTASESGAHPHTDVEVVVNISTCARVSEKEVGKYTTPALDASKKTYYSTQADLAEAQKKLDAAQALNPADPSAVSSAQAAANTAQKKFNTAFADLKDRIYHHGKETIKVTGIANPPPDLTCYKDGKGDAPDSGCNKFVTPGSSSTGVGGSGTQSGPASGPVGRTSGLPLTSSPTSPGVDNAFGQPSAEVVDPNNLLLTPDTGNAKALEDLRKAGLTTQTTASGAPDIPGIAVGPPTGQASSLTPGAANDGTQSGDGGSLSSNPSLPGNTDTFNKNTSHPSDKYPYLALDSDPANASTFCSGQANGCPTTSDQGIGKWAAPQLVASQSPPNPADFPSQVHVLDGNGKEIAILNGANYGLADQAQVTVKASQGGWGSQFGVGTPQEQIAHTLTKEFSSSGSNGEVVRTIFSQKNSETGHTLGTDVGHALVENESKQGWGESIWSHIGGGPPEIQVTASKPTENSRLLSLTVQDGVQGVTPSQYLAGQLARDSANLPGGSSGVPVGSDSSNPITGFSGGQSGSSGRTIFNQENPEIFTNTQTGKFGTQGGPTTGHEAPVLGSMQNIPGLTQAGAPGTQSGEVARGRGIMNQNNIQIANNTQIGLPGTQSGQLSNPTATKNEEIPITIEMISQKQFDQRFPNTNQGDSLPQFISRNVVLGKIEAPLPDLKTTYIRDVPQPFPEYTSPSPLASQETRVIEPPSQHADIPPAPISNHPSSESDGSGGRLIELVQNTAHKSGTEAPNTGGSGDTQPGQNRTPG